MSSETFSLDELCQLANVLKRTVRYYIQLGLVSRPVGEARAARYTGEHLGQLLRIKELSAAGVSLERIREVLAGGESPVPPRPRRPGAVEVRSHVYVAPGLEIQIAPEEAGLTPEQVRMLVWEILKVADAVLSGPKDNKD
jgi:DNA-binding transcriptional MerR regulator